MAPPHEKQLISVVIPCYNRSHVIERAIQSALAQSHTPLEILIVDDGSKDTAKTQQIIENLRDTRISFIPLPVNVGGAKARNIGAHQSKGEFIAFLDSDDEWLPEKLATQIKYLNEHFDTTDKVLISCKTEVHTEFGKAQIWPRLAKPPNLPIAEYLFTFEGFLQTSSFLIRREDFLEVQFNEDLRRHQDFDLVIRLEASGFKFGMHDDVLTILHWEDYHSSKRGFMPEQTISFFNQYQKHLSPRAQSNFLYMHLVDRLLETGQRKKALEIRRKCGLKFRLLTLKNKIGYCSQLLLRDKRALRWIVALKKLGKLI